VSTFYYLLPNPDSVEIRNGRERGTSAL